MTERFNDLMPASWNDDENGELLRRLDSWQEGDNAGPLIRWAAAALRDDVSTEGMLMNAAKEPTHGITHPTAPVGYQCGDAGCRWHGLTAYEPPDPGKPEGGPYPSRPDPGKVEDYSLSGDDRRIAMRGVLAVFGPLTLVALGIGWTTHYWAPLQGIAAVLLILAVIGAWVSLITWAVGGDA